MFPTLTTMVMQGQYSRYIERILRRVLLVLILCASAAVLHAQDRDIRAERLVLDDNGSDGSVNTITFESPAPLLQNVVLKLTDPGSDSAVILLTPAGSSGVWLLNGNVGTTAGTHFLGTSDAAALHLYVNGGSSNSLILNTNGSIQRDSSGNGRGGDAVDLQISRNGSAQVASGTYSTIGGGRRNTAINIAATVAGGDANTAEGRYVTVGGGTGNVARSSDGFVTAAITIGGGQSNTATGGVSTIGGGAHNTVSGPDGVIAGGSNNSISGQTNAILGGVYNEVTGYRSSIGGGDRNLVTSRWSVVPGGRGLTLSGESSFGFLGGNTGGTVVSRGNNRMTVTEEDIALFGNVDLLLANNDGTASRLRFYEANSVVDSFPTGTTFHTSFEAGDQSEDIHYTLPAAAPTVNGQLLSSDTNGVMSWTDGPTGAQSFANAGNTTPTLELENNVGTDDGVALQITEGSVILSNALGASANIPDDVAIYDIDDATASSAPTVGLPTSGANGKILYIYISDPDGATVGGAARATGDKLTYIYISGGWRLFHVN